MNKTTNKVELTAAQKEMFDTIKTASKMTAGLLVTILILCLYLLNRSIEAFGSYIDVFGGGLQVKLYVLGFSYRALTVLFPGVLGALGLAFSHCASKQMFAWNCLLGEKPSLKALLPAIDPYALTPGKLGVPGSGLAWHVIAWLPLTALASHVLSVVFDVWILLQSHGGAQIQDYYGAACVALLMACLGVWGSWSFRRFVIRISKAIDK